MPVVAACMGMMPLPKALVSLVKLAAKSGWSCRVQTARGTWATKTTRRVANVAVARFDREHIAMTATYLDGKAEAGLSNRYGVVGVARVRQLLKQDAGYYTKG